MCNQERQAGVEITLDMIDVGVAALQKWFYELGEPINFYRRAVEDVFQEMACCAEKS
jgi:hypothetical protein